LFVDLDRQPARRLVVAGRRSGRERRDSHENENNAYERWEDTLRPVMKNC
jgi:hypothetical protein